MHEQCSLVTDLFIFDTLRPEPLGELCHFRTPEGIGLFAKKTPESEPAARARTGLAAAIGSVAIMIAKTA